MGFYNDFKTACKDVKESLKRVNYRPLTDAVGSAMHKIVFEWLMPNATAI